MNTPIYPGLTTYDTKNGQRLRLYGVVRGTITDSDAAVALAGIGLASLVFYPSGAELPTDWPTDEPQLKLDSNERLFRAEGTRNRDEAMPTAVQIGDGSVIIFAVWSYAPDVAPSVTPITVGGSMSTGSKMLYLGGALLVAGALGAFLLYRPHPKMYTRRSHRSAMPIFENPIRYDSTVKHRGVTIHVHAVDNGYCADYRAIAGFVTHPGDVACAATRNDALRAAKDHIDAIFMGISQRVAES